MRRSRLPHAGWNNVYYPGDGSVSQILTETVVSEALSRESGQLLLPPRGRKDVLSGLKTAVLWSAVFWAVLYGALRFIL